MHDLKRAVVKIHSTISKCTNMIVGLEWGEEGEIGVGWGGESGGGVVRREWGWGGEEVRREWGWGGEEGEGKWGWGGEGGRKGAVGLGRKERGKWG